MTPAVRTASCPFLAHPLRGALLLLPLALISVPLAALESNPVNSAAEPADNEVWLFGSKNCADCQAFKQWWVDHTEQTKDLKLVNLSVDDIANFKRFLALEKKWNADAGNAFPVAAFRLSFISGIDMGNQLAERLKAPTDDKRKTPVIDSARFVRINKQDMGTIHVYIKNLSEVPLRFKEIRLNENPIPVWGVNLNTEMAMKFFHDNPSTPRDPEQTNGQAAVLTRFKSSDEPVDMRALLRQAAAKQVLWAYFEPESVPPNSIGEFIAKLRHPMHGILQLDFESTGGEVITYRLSSNKPKPPLAWSTITFSPERDRAYLYVESQIDHPQTLLRLEIDGTDRTDDTEFTSRVLDPGRKLLAIVNFNPPLSSVAYITAKMVSTEGVTEDRVRVAHFFPIHTESGIGNPQLALDDESFIARPFSVMDDEKTPYGNQPSGQADYLLECMNHRFGNDWERSAKMLLMRKYLSREHKPERLTISHICRNDPMAAYPRFAKLTDLIEVNPSYSAFDRKRTEPLWDSCRKTLEYARRVHAPKPVVAVISTEAQGDARRLCAPEEFRNRIYSVVAEAPKGVLYRLNTLRDDPHRATTTAIRTEIAKFTRTLRAYRDELAIAEAFPNAIELVPGSAATTARLLLAGDRGLFINLIGEDLRETDNRFFRITLPGLLQDRLARAIARRNELQGTAMRFSTDDAGLFPAQAVFNASDRENANMLYIKLDD